MWSNFHMHSDFCDGKGDMADYVQQALEKNMISIGFSSHAPVPFASSWCMKADRLHEYLNRIDTVRRETTSIEIYKGLEVDFIPGMIGPTDFETKLDYTIGSVHFIDAFDENRPWEIDGLHSLFLEGLEKIFQGNIRSVIKRYYELTRQMLETSCPTVVGHLDKIKIQNIENKFYHESDDWYQEEMDKTIEVIKGSGAIVEVNTRGLYQGKSSTPYPSPWILEKLLKKGVPVTISSDTHHPSDIINRFPETAEQLLKIGFKSIYLLYEGKWQPFSFNSHGIIR